MSIRVTVDKRVAELEDQIALNIEINGTRNRANFQLPKLTDFHLLNLNPSTSSSVSIVNGNMTQKVTYTYFLRPRKEGTLTVPKFQISVEGKQFTTNPIQVTVSKNAANNKNASKPAFLKMTLSTLKPVVNQEVTAQTKLYIKQGVRIYNNSVSFGDEPSLNGFWKESYDLKSFEKLPSEVVNGVHYEVFLVRKEGLFPTHKGKMDVESVQLTLGVIEQSSQRRRRSFFDDAFFGGGGKVRNITISSPKQTLSVKDFPASSDKHFTRFSGKLSLQASVDKKSPKTNDAVKLSIIIEGEGNFQTLDIPEFFISPDLEKYEPSVKSNVFKNRNKIAGKKAIEYVLVPRIEGEQKIGPIQLSYYDLDKKKITKLVVPEIVLNVAKGKSHTTVASASAEDLKKSVKQIDLDIRYIRTESDGFVVRGDYIHTSVSYYLMYIVLILLFIGLYVFLKSRESLATDTNLRRKKEANAKVTKVLKEAHSKKDQGDSAGFFAAINTSITNYVADKLSMDAAGFTSESLKDVLVKQSVEDELISEVIDILNSCDFYRFSNPDNPEEAMDTMYNRTSDVLHKLTKSI